MTCTDRKPYTCSLRLMRPFIRRLMYLAMFRTMHKAMRPALHRPRRNTGISVLPPMPITPMYVHVQVDGNPCRLRHPLLYRNKAYPPAPVISGVVKFDYNLDAVFADLKAKEQTHPERMTHLQRRRPDRVGDNNFSQSRSEMSAVAQCVRAQILQSSLLLQDLSPKL